MLNAFRRFRLSGYDAEKVMLFTIWAVVAEFDTVECA